MIFNDKFGALSPDYLNNSQKPKVVLQQVGENDMYVFFVEERIVHIISIFSKSIFDYFDPKSTIYFYEPGRSKSEPHFERLELPIFMIVSPEISRYKEFTKNGGKKLYMPLLTREELVTIGNFLVKENKVSGLEDFYSKENIVERYEEFGGIYRHVFPSSIDYVKQIRLVKKIYIENLSKETKEKLVLNADIENIHISHLVARYIVEKKEMKHSKNFQ